MSVMGGESWIAAAACWLSLLPAGMRWLRVAQREHYLPGSASRFAFRWWGRGRENWPLAIAALVGFGISWRYPIAGVATAVVVVLGPIGLSVRGRTSRLGMTRRVSTLAVVWLALEGGSVAIGFVVHREAFFAALGSVAVPLLVDAGCEVTAPVERWLGSRFVARARKRLELVDPTVVAITGSFGKTSTKNYVAHLLGSSRRVVASPASYNNRAGLARTMNEYLADGTEVFVAEMGTYGRGEIAELCQWCPPDIAVITAIGPVHLERFGSEDAILEAKSEIVRTAGTVVLNVDNHWLAELAVRLSLREDPPVVIRCSARARDADVFVEDARGSREVRLHGEVLAGAVELAAGVQPTNAACAIAVAFALGLSRGEIAARLAELPSVPHRLAVATAPSGVVVIDDTFNSNPSGASAALGLLAAMSGARRVVVTPGMVELGVRQREENREFARKASEIATDVLVVGRTNRSALADGIGPGRATLVRTREDAVGWVRANLVDGDVVLYENDLPDHYP